MSLAMPDQWNLTIQGNYGTPKINLTHGSGCEVWDEKGNRYLDLLGGIATNILGHAHPALVEAISNQIARLNHVSNFYAHPEVLELAKTLQRLVGVSSARTFFCNSGTEANEAALKLSRLTGRQRIVAFEGGFHGRTMGSLSMTGQREKREPFKPLIKKIKFAEFNDVKSVKKTISKKTAMVILEPIQGEVGVIPFQTGFLKEIREMTSELGVLLALDCVQTGMGRTGTWFGFESEGITPDIITLAKGLGGGLPIGAMIATGPAAKLFQAGSHGSTFGGNPVAAASANATIEVIERENYLSHNKARGLELKTRISTIGGIKEVRGSGLLLGIVLSDDRAKEIADNLLERGILVNAANKSVIRIAPAYVISADQLEEFITAFREVMEK